jgi:hypothetical protein
MVYSAEEILQTYVLKELSGLSKKTVITPIKKT